MNGDNTDPLPGWFLLLMGELSGSFYGLFIDRDKSVMIIPGTWLEWQ